MDEEFRAACVKELKAYDTEGSPFEQLSQYKRVIRSTARALLSNPSHARQSSSLSKITTAVALLRLLTKPNPSHEAIDNYIHSHPSLAHLYTPMDFTYTYNSITDYIHKQLDTAQPAGEDTDQKAHHQPPTSPPHAPTRQVSHSEHIIDRIKTLLPSTRKKLAVLSPPTTDGGGADTTDVPAEMAGIIKSYWSRIWQRDKSAPRLRRIISHLNYYNKTIPDHLMPIMPNQDQVEECILKSGNSSPGPDGIPFSAHRLLHDYAAPIFHGVIVSLASGVDPPPEFNSGRLVLIPKSDSPTIDRTRPITMNNTDNRIIAKLITTIITPAIDHIVSASQKGFIPGRRGSDHIRTLNHRFYTAKMQRTQHYILFLDTAKAFDSIHHDFIHAMLTVIKAPDWLLSVILALLHHVTVTPALREHVECYINIERGVKQGCPLSPLLFALCYDPLLVLLDSNPSLTNCAFADDLAISSPSLSHIISTMPIIDTFRRFSGLGVNYSKTHIITTRKPSSTDKKALKEAPGEWSKVEFSDAETYLGVLMGSAVSTEMIFSPAMGKFEERLRVYKPILRHCPPHQRIVAINTFLISLFSYLIEFFILPYNICTRIQALVTPLIIPLRSITYPHLVAPHSSGGPRQPLRDLWAAGAARLASQYDLSKFDGSHPDAVSAPEGKRYVLNKSFQSMLIEDHIMAAAFDYLILYAPRDQRGHIALQLPTDLDGGTEGLEAKRRKIVYAELVDQGWRDGRLQQNAAGTLPTKLQRWTADEGATTALLDNWKRITKATPDYAIIAFIRMLHNSTPTERRLAGSKVPVAKRTSPKGPNPCFLCGGVEAGTKLTDSLEHLLERCPVARRARELFHASLALAPPTHSTKHALLLTPSTNSKYINSTISFNTSLISHINNYFKTRSEPPRAETGARRIARFAITTWALTAPNKWKPSPALLTNTLPHVYKQFKHKQNTTAFPDYTKRSSSTFGSAGKRTPTQARAARDYATALLKSIPQNSVICFTDGSANPNPGPCGAGVFLYTKPPTIKRELSISLGHGTNNVGELFAVGAAAQLTSQVCASRTNFKHLFILTDSRLTKSYIDKTAKPKTAAMRRLVQAVHYAIDSGPELDDIAVRTEWVPAHLGIVENEHADYLAGLGSTNSKLGRTNASRITSIRTGNFLPAPD
jgi:ribonuclease HI